MQRVALIFCIALAVPASLGALGNPIDYSRPYVNLAPRTQFRFPFHKTVRDALLKLEVPYIDSGEGSKVDLEGLKTNLKAAEENERDDTYKQVYKNVLDVISLKDDCSKQFTKVYLTIWAQSIEIPELVPFFQFMNAYAPRKFQSCSMRVNDQFKKEPIKLDAAEELYKVLSGTFFEPKDLYSRLKVFSMASSKFDVSRMAEMANGFQNPSSPPRDVYSFLRTFWLTRCERFDEGPLPRMLDVLGIARQFSNNLEGYDAGLLLLSEYRRLCSEWIYQEEKVKKNIAARQ